MQDGFKNVPLYLQVRAKTMFLVAIAQTDNYFLQRCLTSVISYIPPPKLVFFWENIHFAAKG